MASVIYDQFKYMLGKKQIDLSADTFYASLHNTTTTCPSDAQSGITHVVDFATLAEVTTSGTGYARVALTSLTWARDDSNSRAKWTCATVNYGAITSGAGTIKGALVIFHVDGTNANDVPVMWDEFSSNLVTDGSNVSIQLNAAGLLDLT